MAFLLTAKNYINTFALSINVKNKEYKHFIAKKDFNY